MPKYEMSGGGDATFTQVYEVEAATPDEARELFGKGKGTYVEGAAEVNQEDFEWDFDSLEEA